MTTPSMRRRARLGAFILFVLVAACDRRPGDDVRDLHACDAGGEPSVHMQPIASPVPLGPLLVRGSVSAPSDVAVHSVTVAGLPVTRETFNFRSFSLDVPADVFTAAQDPNSHIATLSVVATDACGRTGEAELNVMVMP